MCERHVNDTRRRRQQLQVSRVLREEEKKLTSEENSGNKKVLKNRNATMLRRCRLFSFVVIAVAVNVVVDVVVDVDASAAPPGPLQRGLQLGPDPNMPPEELLSFSNNNNNFNEFGKSRSSSKGSLNFSRWRRNIGSNDNRSCAEIAEGTSHNLQQHGS